MIEISTIQDIRQIENKLIAGFTGRQLIAFIIGCILDTIVYLTTHSTFIILVVSAVVMFFGFFKKGNLTAFEFLELMWDKEQQPRIRTYKNKNIISEIEHQCKLYKSPKKKKSS